jgi:hypothetical protein
MLLDEPTNPALRRAAASALGHAGFDASIEQALRAKLQGPTRVEAAVALLLGGSSEGARAAAQAAPGDVLDAYRASLFPPSKADLDEGRLFRQVDNVLSSPSYRDVLATALRDIEYDNGPHSLTRVRLRFALERKAHDGSASDKRLAISTLELMRERGVLLALSDADGDASQLARDALARLAKP